MTKDDIEAVFDRVRTWPTDRQAYAAFVLLDLERESVEPYELSKEETAALDEAEASGVASDEQVQRVLGQRFPTA